MITNYSIKEEILDIERQTREIEMIRKDMEDELEEENDTRRKRL